LSGEERLVAVGRVGAPHGRDGSFWVEGPVAGAASEGSGGNATSDGAVAEDPLAEGAELTVAGRSARVERRAGTRERPLLRLDRIADRSAAAELRDERLLVPEMRAPLGPGEWLVDDLLGARVEGLGEVRRVLAGPSCDVLEVGDEPTLVPLVADAIRGIDVGAGVIEVDHRFLGLAEEEAARG
jgi:16S rRNA processing protein RimM